MNTRVGQRVQGAYNILICEHDNKDAGEKVNGSSKQKTCQNNIKVIQFIDTTFCVISFKKCEYTNLRIFS